MSTLDPILLKVIDELDALGKTRDDAWQVPRVEGELLHQIALSSHAKIIVEIVTSYGFSGLFWAGALKRTGGRLHTIDKDPKKYDASREAFRRAGVDDVVTNYLGDAQQVLQSTPISGAIDIAFIDADKPATEAYFSLLWPRLRRGGSVVIDNVTTHRQELGGLLRSIRSRTDASSVEIAVGNGIEWVIKLT